MSKENILVVGGGGAGVAITTELSAKLDPAKYNLILITPRDFYIHLLAGLRIVVSDIGSWEESAFIPYDGIFTNGNGSVKKASVTEIHKSKGVEGGEVVLSTGETIPFKLLVVATGSNWEGVLAFPDNTAELKSHITELRQKFHDAKSVVIGGGGAVGLELAGEILDIYPETKITIVQKDYLPLNSTYPDKFRKDVVRRWKERGVDFIFDDAINEFPTELGSQVTTQKGAVLKADLFIPTRGGRPNTDVLKSLGSDTLSAHGTVRIKDTFQLVDHPDIFAAGDIIDWKEQKQLAKIGGHAATVVANILLLLSGKPANKPYGGIFEAIFLTNGKAKGAGYANVLWGLSFGDRLVPMVKSATLFVPKQRQAMKAPPVKVA